MKNIKKQYQEFFPTVRTRYLARELVGCDSVLDLGCGEKSPLEDIKFKGRKVAVDNYQPYLNKLMKRKNYDRYIKADITNVEFPRNSFDAVILLDVLEHLKKRKGKGLLRKMECWARKKIIIYTPNGFIEQHISDKNKLQEHLSGWDVYDFWQRKYDVKGMHGLKVLRTAQADIRFKPKLFWRVISDLSQKFTYHYPSWAFQLFAVKEVGK